MAAVRVLAQAGGPTFGFLFPVCKVVHDARLVPLNLPEYPLHERFTHPWVYCGSQMVDLDRRLERWTHSL